MRGQVGTELAKLIPEWAVQVGEGCGCKDMQNRMNRWGVEGCILHKNAIISHLLSQSDRLIPAFKLVPAPMKKVAAARLLRKAILNAQA